MESSYRILRMREAAADEVDLAAVAGDPGRRGGQLRHGRRYVTFARAVTLRVLARPAASLGPPEDRRAGALDGGAVQSLCGDLEIDGRRGEQLRRLGN
jgi:hypothetical protein